MLGDAALASQMAAKMLERGIYVVRGRGWRARGVRRPRPCLRPRFTPPGPASTSSPPPAPKVGFSYPVVPKGQARIRVQLSAAHERAHIDAAVDAFVAVGRELGVIP
jgi:7-keto-8-aminopelargonate synthetase-like enzyme